MPCRHVQIIFDDYIAGTLDDKGRRLVENHLNDCPECREIWESLEPGDD